MFTLKKLLEMKKSIFFLYLLLFLFLFSSCVSLPFTKRNKEIVEQKTKEEGDVKKEKIYKQKEEDLDKINKINSNSLILKDNRYFGNVKEILKIKRKKEEDSLYKEEEKKRILCKNYAFFCKKIKFSASNQKLYGVLETILNNYSIILDVDSNVNLDVPVTFSFYGDIYDFLEKILLPYGYGYKFIPPNKLKILGYITKIYTINLLNLKTSFMANFNSSTTGQETAGTANQSIVLKTIMADTDIWKKIESDISSLLTADGKFSINPDTGTIIITDKVSVFNKVDKYIKYINDTLSRGVFIKVRMMEVRLDKEHEHGLDWNFIAKVTRIKRYKFYATSNLGEGTKGLLGQKVITPTIDGKPVYLTATNDLPYPIFTIVNSEGVVRGVLNAINRQGKMRVLSQPHLFVLNGHPTVIPIGDMINYIKNVTKETDDTGGNTYSYETASLQTGTVLQFLPYIKKDGKILLNLSFTENRLREMKEVNVGDIHLELPQTSVRAIHTTVMLSSGETMIIGGILDSIQTKKEASLPVFDKIPLVGELFKHKERQRVKTELIIMITAYSYQLNINDNGAYSNVDVVNLTD